jgi:hypothetical protein
MVNPTKFPPWPASGLFDTEGKSKVSCLVCQGNNFYVSLNHRRLSVSAQYLGELEFIGTSL